jgi:outer membrane protein assembly factor BamB
MRRSVIAAAAAAVILLVLVGSLFYIAGPPVVKSSQSAGTSTASQSSGAASSVAGGAEDWTTYHADNARTGYQQASNFTSVTNDWNSTTLDGAVYAEPLVFGGDVFVATENNSVYALDARTGSQVWRTNLGLPVARSQLQCGDIDPTGITGTPVVDPSSGTLFVVSFSGLKHTLSEIRASTGAVVFQRPADPPGSVVTAQQERSALSLANGVVYIPYGGLAGDCGQYHGWVVGWAADGSGGMLVYQVPTGNEGGLWAPSGAAVDQSGNVYVTTGNGASNTTFDHGNSVIVLSPSLKAEGYFAPTNWAQLNQNDADLGSLGPAIVGPDTLFQIGKEGVGYLLNSSRLGGVGGQTFSADVCDESFGGTAYSSPYIFVPCINGLVELQAADGAFTKVWLAGALNAGPPIVTGGVVWTVDSNSGTLYGFSVATGHQAYAFPLGSVVHFTSPAAGAGRVFVAAGDKVVSFLLG